MATSARAEKIHASISFEDQSGLPRDRVVNNFHFAVNTYGPLTDLDNVADLITDFFFVTPPGDGGSVADLMSPSLEGSWELKMYNLGDTPPRLPIRVDTGTYADFGSAGSGAPLPREVALKVSTNAAYIGGFPKARQQGGFFVGPLAGGSNIITTDGLSAARPASVILDRLKDAIDRMIAAALASASTDFVVASLGARDNTVSTGHPGDEGYVLPKNRPLLDPEYFVIEHRWVDDEFDTIRRRGLRATNRGAA